LIEKVQGNNFKTKVYPIEPLKSREVKVEFTCDLSVHLDEQKNRHGLYTLPIDFPETLKEFKMEVKTSYMKQKPFSDENSGLVFVLDEKSSSYVATIKKETNLTNGMVIIVPNVYDDCILLEKGKSNPEETYFSICDFIKGFIVLAKFD
jgi:hypothetical protein